MQSEDNPAANSNLNSYFNYKMLRKVADQF